MDEPHWYALDNVLGKKIEEEGSNNQTITRYVDWWIDANGQEVEIFASQDALKILYEDGIPLGSMINNNMLLGNRAYANVENNTSGLIWDSSENVGARIHGTITGSEDPPSEYDVGEYIGKIAGAIVDVSGEGISSLASSTNAYFFYAGTAPSPTIISFSLTPEFNSSGIFTAINNTFINENTPYNMITIESIEKQKLSFTTPNLITSYNTAVKILQDGRIASATTLDMRDEIIKKVRHPAVRKWANAILTAVENGGTLTKAKIASRMEEFFKNNSNNFTEMQFSFNSKTGEAIGEFIYREPTQAFNLSNSTISNSNIVNATEDIGDMLMSNNIIIKERNYPNEYGKIVCWQDTEAGHKYSHRIYHDLSVAIKNLQIVYKYMYL